MSKLLFMLVFYAGDTTYVLQDNLTLGECVHQLIIEQEAIAASKTDFAVQCLVKE